ncbi:MAG: LysM peptidoglycan-binding domain-containing protein [Deltaproteobacteria bacterium]|nr:LysM peptidoglycan-binding domain-containing protein [Deltaproteobacteria bacterium]
MGKGGRKGEVHGFLQEEGFATQEYVVQEGDWLTKILRKKGVLQNYDADELLEVLRQLNDSLKNINLIRPGEKIVILVKVMPKEKETLKAPYHTYTVQAGDSLHKLASERYGLSDKTFTKRYLPLLKKYNPTVKDPDIIHPGQKIRLPVYPPPSRSPKAQTSVSPSIARDVDTRSRVTLADPRIVMRSFDLEARPSESSAPQTPERRPPGSPVPPKPNEPAPPVRVHENRFDDHGMVIVLAEDVGKVFSAMGEEWVDQGEHFIPMKSGGQINLSTEKYPLLRLQQGATVIVDLSSTLPQKMVRLIESTWSGYRVVSISARDTLSAALGKILHACNYPKIFKRGQPLELGGSVRIQVTADWIVVPPEADRGPRFMAISLTGPNTTPLPDSMVDYLALMGIEVIEYPPVNREGAKGRKATPVQAAQDANSLIRSVLNITGRPHRVGHKVAAFSSQEDDFELVIQADFFLENHSNGAIIDLSGLDAKVVSLLNDRGVDVLSVSGETPLLPLLGKVLKFLHVKHENGPHTFRAVPGEAATNVRVTVPGVVFRNPDGGLVLATSASLPSEMVRFLSGKGYQVLVLSETVPGRAQKG